MVEKGITVGAYNKTASVTQFQATDIRNKGVHDDVGHALRQKRFVSFQNKTDSMATGWVELDDYQETDFEFVKRDHLFAFAFRRDKRTIPASVMKMHLRKKEREFLSNNPSFQRVPRTKKDELRENIIAELLPKVLPTMSVIDVLWDVRTGVVTAYTTSLSQLDDLAELFRETFNSLGVELSFLHPVARAKGLIPDDLQNSFDKMVSGEDVSSIINGNAWIGREFLEWLFAGSIDGDNAYMVQVDGPGSTNDGFSAYIDNKLLLSGESKEGSQKVSISGPQNNFSEVLKALQEGKGIGEATVYFDLGDFMSCLTLKGRTFQFASIKIPAIQFNAESEEDERDTLLFELSEGLRMCLQLFDSVFLKYLKLRLDPKLWSSEHTRLSSLVNKG